VGKKHTVIPYAVFVIAISIVSINLISVLFPALISALTSGSQISIDPLEPGIWAIPVLVTNIVILFFGILYYSKKLPKVIPNFGKFILNFEVSKRIAGIVIIILIVTYVALTVQEITINEEEEWKDFVPVRETLEVFKDKGLLVFDTSYVKYFLIYVSEVIFQNVRVVPYIASILLVLLTYFFTVEITKKRFAGLIAMVVLLQSGIFLRYDTLATYSNFWVLFYLLSVYTMYKKWPISPISYLLSIFSKPIMVFTFPISFFIIYMSNLSRRKKVFLGISYVAMTLALISYFLATHATVWGDFTEFNTVDFWAGFTTLSYQLRFDVFILLFLLPVTVGLFLTSISRNSQASTVLALIIGSLLLSPLILATTDYNMQPYRYVPLVVFFAIGIGTMFSKDLSKISELKQKKSKIKPSFIDPNKDPKYYIQRYFNEPKYKEWFDRNYPDYTIFEAVGISESEYFELKTN